LNTYIEIGKSIISKYAIYAKKKIIDDEEEYFPTLKIIILGIVEISNQKKSTEEELIQYSREQYISTWLEYAKQEEKNPDINKEIQDAEKRFDEIYFNTKFIA
jgi:hypothetical protein